jgi:hypothetical protein
MRHAPAIFTNLLILAQAVRYEGIESGCRKDGVEVAA